jgi:DNA-binding transcriptional MerR regulator/effector-binding domain-containing protein
MAEKLYTVRKIAESFGISTDTLKIYEEKGLFIPKYVNKQTNYRYYEAGQTFLLRNILTLKDQGFSLDEIKKMLDRNMTSEEKHQKILTKYKQVQYSLAQYELYLPHPGGKTIKLITIARHYKICRDIIASKREDILSAFDAITDEVIENRLRWTVPAFPYCIFTNENISLEKYHCCPSFEIQWPMENTADLNISSIIREFPEYSCLSFIYRGDYGDIREAYQSLDAYAQEHKIPVENFYIERYIVNKDNSYLADTFVTEVLLPISDSKVGGVKR